MIILISITSITGLYFLYSALKIYYEPNFEEKYLYPYYKKYHTHYFDDGAVVMSASTGDSESLRKNLIRTRLLITFLFFFVSLIAFSHSDRLEEKQMTSIDRLVAAVISYKIPDSMSVGKSDTIYVTISKKFNLTVVRDLTNDSIKTSSRVKLKLVDPEADKFNIVSLSSEEQWIDNDEPTVWRWSVIPKKSGTNPLLILPTIILGGKDNVMKDIILPQKKVNVSAPTLIEIRDHFVEYWTLYSFLLTAILIPLFTKIFSSRNSTPSSSTISTNRFVIWSIVFIIIVIGLFGHFILLQ